MDKSKSKVEWKKNTVPLLLYKAIWALDGDIAIVIILPNEDLSSLLALFMLYGSILSFLIIDKPLIVSLLLSLINSFFVPHGLLHYLFH